MYTLLYPVYYIKVGFNGVYISRTCYADDVFIIMRLIVALHSSTLSLELLQHNSKAELYFAKMHFVSYYYFCTFLLIKHLKYFVSCYLDHVINKGI